MSASQEVNFTARDFDLLAKAMICLKTEPAVDYAQFAEIGVFKNANSAKASWHGIKQKLDKLASGASLMKTAQDGTVTAAPASGKKRKAASQDDASEVKDKDDETATAVGTPAKKKRGRPSKKTVVAKENDTTGEDDKETKLDEAKVKAEAAADEEEA